VYQEGDMADMTFENVTDERTARAVIASVTETGDFQTNTVLRLAGNGLDTLRLALSNELIVGMQRADLHLWRRRFDVADPVQVFEGIEQSERLGQHILIPGDPHWPAALDPLDHRTPLALWTQGDTTLLADSLASRAALIGTPNPSLYGLQMATALAADLAADGRTIVSFPDDGIAEAAITSALKHNDRVILVMPDPINQSQIENYDWLEQAATTSLLVTDRPPSDIRHTSALTANGLLAALSGMTTVVEEQAGWDYRWTGAPFHAAAYGRPVGAAPGRATDVASHGTNALIREGRATLVQSHTDITELLDASPRGLLTATLAQNTPQHTVAREYSLTR